MKLDDTQRHWDEFARQDPMFAILTDPAKRGNRWDPEAFFLTGQHDIDGTMQTLAGLGLPLARARALDFGCGLGRLVQALARHFDVVTGVDISASMVEQARALNQFGDRVQYVVNTSEALEQFPSASFDLVHSVLVLQHLEPRYARGYIAEFLRLLKPGGVAWFQVPHRFWVRKWLRHYWPRLAPFTGWCPEPVLCSAIQLANRLINAYPRMEMHHVPRPDVERVARDAGCVVLQVFPDQCAGEMFDSFTYAVQKPPGPTGAGAETAT